MIGVASTAPGYSLAATLGLIAGVAGLGLQSPAIMIVSFIPMLFIAAAYYYMNRADPDCGTTFTWVTKAMGPKTGWFGGWGIIVADILVMPSLAHVAGNYTFLLFGWQSAADDKWGDHRGHPRRESAQGRHPRLDPAQAPPALGSPRPRRTGLSRRRGGHNGVF